MCFHKELRQVNVRLLRIFLTWRHDASKKKGSSFQITTEWKLDDAVDGRNHAPVDM